VLDLAEKPSSPPLASGEDGNVSTHLHCAAVFCFSRHNCQSRIPPVSLRLPSRSHPWIRACHAKGVVKCQVGLFFSFANPSCLLTLRLLVLLVFVHPDAFLPDFFFPAVFLNSGNKRHRIDGLSRPPGLTVDIAVPNDLEMSLVFPFYSPLIAPPCMFSHLLHCSDFLLSVSRYF